MTRRPVPIAESNFGHLDPEGRDFLEGVADDIASIQDAPLFRYIRSTLAGDLVGGDSVDVAVGDETYTLTNIFYDNTWKYESGVTVGAVWIGTATSGKWNMDVIAASDCPVKVS